LAESRRRQIIQGGPSHPWPWVEAQNPRALSNTRCDGRENNSQPRLDFGLVFAATGGREGAKLGDGAQKSRFGFGGHPGTADGFGTKHGRYSGIAGSGRGESSRWHRRFGVRHRAFTCRPSPDEQMPSSCAIQENRAPHASFFMDGPTNAQTTLKQKKITPQLTDGLSTGAGGISRQWAGRGILVLMFGKR